MKCFFGLELGENKGFSFLLLRKVNAAAAFVLFVGLKERQGGGWELGRKKKMNGFWGIAKN